MKSLIIILCLVMAVMPQSLIKKTVIEEGGFQAFTATAYCLSGRASNGLRVTNSMIAVDTRIIPLNSTVEILGLGTFLAADRGGLIKGKIVDIHMSCSNAIRWGRKQIKLRILHRK